MAELVRLLLDDLGLYGTPSTFPELVMWVVAFVVGAALIAGTIKTFLIVCLHFGDRRSRW